MTPPRDDAGRIAFALSVAGEVAHRRARGLCSVCGVVRTGPAWVCIGCLSRLGAALVNALRGRWGA